MNTFDFAMRACLLCCLHRGSVTSWGRTEKRNALVHGVEGSFHLVWEAIDVVLDDQKKDLVFEKDADRFGLIAIYEGDHYHLQSK